MASERQKLQNTFEELQQFLREQEGVLLARLDQAREELTTERRKYVSSVLERKSLLDTLIAEIEKKRDQPVVEFLTVRLHCPPGRCDPPPGAAHPAPLHLRACAARSLGAKGSTVPPRVPAARLRHRGAWCGWCGSGPAA